MPYKPKIVACHKCHQPYKQQRPENHQHLTCPTLPETERLWVGTETAFTPGPPRSVWTMPIVKPFSYAGPLKILVIPDTQIKPDVDLRYLSWVGKYIVEKKPDVVIHIGDAVDMPSLSSYDRGKKSFEGRRYVNDIKAGVAGMKLLMDPLERARDAGYNPRLILTLGNHEDRITRATEEDARLDGTIGLQDLRYEEFGWEVYPYLKPVEVGGVEFAHYFTSGVMGRPVSSAAALLRARQGSAIMGHVQMVDIAIHQKTQKTAMFVGVCNLQDEEYLGYQGNNCRRQVVMLHEVRNGLFDPMLVSLGFLERRYSNQ